MSIENTSSRDPMLHLLGAMSDGSSGYIEGMEAAGQRQLVSSASLPTKTGGNDPAFLALGFTFGVPDTSDSLFRAATLPDGWTKRGSDHAMWSYILDEHGRQRVSIFYKAAFYDRRAFMRLDSVHNYVWTLIESGRKPVLDDSWCTRTAVDAVVADERTRRAEQVDLYESKLGDKCAPWAAEELTRAKRAVVELDRFVAQLGGAR
jgi:hypothetical protein